MTTNLLEMREGVGVVRVVTTVLPSSSPVVTAQQNLTKKKSGRIISTEFTRIILNTTVPTATLLLGR